MSNNYLKHLILISKSFAKQHDILDIILYGSAIKGKETPRDIDILLIFNKKPLKERAVISQKLKEKLKIKEIDIKTINLEELFQKDFLARQGILIEGYSLLYQIKFSERMGFVGYALFTYNLKSLNHNEKTKFTYALIGRKTQGMIKQLEAEPLGKGVVIVPIKNSIIFEEFLQKWNVNYKKRSILISLL